jgi:hypothetical protein
VAFKGVKAGGGQGDRVQSKTKKNLASGDAAHLTHKKTNSQDGPLFQEDLVSREKQQQLK